MSLKKNNDNEALVNYVRLLNYPFDSSRILRKKHAIKKELLVKNDLITKRIAILGGSTTAEVIAILELFLLAKGIKPEFYESGFDRYYEEAVFGEPGLNQFQPDVIYIHTTNKNIKNYPSITDSIDQIEQHFLAEQNKYRTLWASLADFHCPIIQNNFELPQQRVLGNLEAYDPHGAVNYIARLNTFLAEEAHKQSNLHINDLNYLAASLGLTQWFDYSLWLTARYALSFEAIPYLAQSLAAIMGSLFGLSKKCIVMDLDNTCWGGVIGDDGLEGIALGKETAVGEAYSEFQTYLKLLKERGIVLAVCSKNELQQAKEGFKHPDTVLLEHDFAAFEANWDPKPATLIKISESINLGLDSMVFIDDNPAERQLIEDYLPEVRVPNIGCDVLTFIEHLDKNKYFETVLVSMEDKLRTDFYQQNLNHPHQGVDYDKYLNSLSMTAEIKPFSSLYLPRIVQLINKTHQFNLTNKTYSLAEIELITQRSDHVTLYGRLEDCYSEHGLISVLIGRIQDKECHIDTWLMSCRVLKRTMEYAVFDVLIARCKVMGIKTIVGHYDKTVKNSLVAYLYEELGFKPVESRDSIWSLEVEQYVDKNKHIQVKQ